jgi:hypothetical protein
MQAPGRGMAAQATGEFGLSLVTGGLIPILISLFRRGFDALESALLVVDLNPNKIWGPPPTFLQDLEKEFLVGRRLGLCQPRVGAGQQRGAGDDGEDDIVSNAGHHAHGLTDFPDGMRGYCMCGTRSRGIGLDFMRWP